MASDVLSTQTHYTEFGQISKRDRCVAAGIEKAKGPRSRPRDDAGDEDREDEISEANAAHYDYLCSGNVFKRVVLDEAQKMKNARTQSTIMVSRLYPRYLKFLMAIPMIDRALDLHRFHFLFSYVLHLQPQE